MEKNRNKKHRHQYEFRFGVMTSPACIHCGKTPTTTRVKLIEPKNRRAFMMKEFPSGSGFVKIWTLE